MRSIKDMLGLMKNTTLGTLNLMMVEKNTLIYTLVLTLPQQLVLGTTIVLLWLLALLIATITMLLSIGGNEFYQWTVLTRYLKLQNDTSQYEE